MSNSVRVSFLNSKEHQARIGKEVAGRKQSRRIDSFIYLSYTRPGTALALIKLATSNTHPGETHLKALFTIHLIRYIRDGSQLGLIFFS
jgi:hypothetical protein